MFSTACALLALVFPLLCVAGWVFGIPLLTQGSPTFPPMMPYTAFVLFVAGSLALLPPERAKARPGAGALTGLLVSLFGVFFLSEYISGADFGVDRLFLPATFEFHYAFPGRPSPQTAFNFILLGPSLACLYWRRMPILTGQIAAVAMAANSLIAATGYIFSTTHFYGFPIYAPDVGMAIQTTLSFGLLSAAVLCRRPDEGVMTLLSAETQSAVTARRIVLSIVLSPLAVGAATRIGVIAGWYSVDFQVSLFIVLMVGVVLRSTWVSARQAESEELRAQAALAATRRMNDRLAVMLDENTRLNRDAQRAKRVADNIPSMLAYWDKNQVCRFANRAYFEWFGIRAGELIGRTMKDLMGTELYEMNRPYIERALAGELQRFERLLKWQPTGAMRHTSATYIPDAVDGEIAGIFVLVHDVTDLKQAQLEALQEKEKALAAVRTREDVLAIVSHDLKNPLTTVGLSAELFQRSAEEIRPAQIRDLGRRIERTVEWMLTLIGDLLDFSKIQSGTFAIQPCRERVEDLIQSAVERLRSLADSKKLTLEWDCPQDLPPVACDPRRIGQVLANLLGNAIKFTPERGSIRVTARCDGDAVEITVRDNGPGIDPGHLPHIFDRYWQPGETRHLGTGLGLAIARGIIEAHGARIWAESRLGEGSAFRFTLPLATAATPRSQPAIIAEGA